MRYPPDHKGKTRARIIGVAGRLFRREGYHAAGVDKVMAAAGLTAGGFYSHFPSKDALLAEALEQAAAETGERLAPRGENRSGRAWIDGFLEGYLSGEHCGAIEDGCPLAALLSELARADERVRERFEGIVRGLASNLARHASECGADDAERRSLAAVALCLGGLGLARAVRDERYANQILESCRSAAAEILGIVGDGVSKGKVRRGGRRS